MLSLCSHYHSNTRHFLGQSPPAPAPSTRGIGRRRRSRRFVAAESGIGWTDSPPFWRTTVAIFALFGAQSSPSPRGIGRRRRRRRRYVAAGARDRNHRPLPPAVGMIYYYYYYYYYYHPSSPPRQAVIITGILRALARRPCRCAQTAGRPPPSLHFHAIPFSCNDANSVPPPPWHARCAVFAVRDSPFAAGLPEPAASRGVAAVQKVKLSSCHRQHQLSFSRPACRRRERRGGPGVQAIASRIPALQHRSASATPSRRGAPAGTRRARAHARHFAFSGANRNHGMLCFSLDDSPPARLTEVGGVGGAQRRAVVAAPRQAHRLPPAACVCLCVCVCVCV